MVRTRKTICVHSSFICHQKGWYCKKTYRVCHSLEPNDPNGKSRVLTKDSRIYMGASVDTHYYHSWSSLFTLLDEDEDSPEAEK
jgi:hypothetical protein